MSKPPRDLYFGNLMTMEEPSEVAHDHKLNEMVKLVSFEHKANFLTIPGQHVRSYSDTVTPMSRSSGSGVGGSGDQALTSSEPDWSKRGCVYGSYQEMSLRSGSWEDEQEKQQAEADSGVRTCINVTYMS